MTPHRTADSLRALPAPTIAPVIVCVVETGMPSAVARERVPAPLVSAQKPPTGASFVICVPNATKLNTAAHTTAVRGLSMRVETTVAIEFAASWKPLMKSNAKSAIIATSARVMHTPARCPR